LLEPGVPKDPGNVETGLWQGVAEFSRETLRA